MGAWEMFEVLCAVLAITVIGLTWNIWKPILAWALIIAVVLIGVALVIAAGWWAYEEWTALSRNDRETIAYVVFGAFVVWWLWDAFGTSEHGRQQFKRLIGLAALVGIFALVGYAYFDSLNHSAQTETTATHPNRPWERDPIAVPANEFDKAVAARNGFTLKVFTVRTDDGRILAVPSTDETNAKQYGEEWAKANLANRI
jgi:hypothetical protein